MNAVLPRPRRSVLGLAGLAGMTALAGCLSTSGFSLGAPRRERFEERFDPTTVDHVEVANVVGDVTIRGADRDDVLVTVVKRSQAGQTGLDAIDVRAEIADAVLSVEVDFSSTRVLTPDGQSADVRITVPHGRSGPRIRSLETDVGTISLDGTRGNTVAKTDLGDVLATDVDGYLTLETELGDVDATGVRGLDRAVTELGDVTADLYAARGDVAIRTDLGSVVLGVAADLDLDVLAKCEGAVTSDLELTALERAADRVAGRLNAGGPQLLVSSDLGDVDLRRIPGRSRS